MAELKLSDIRGLLKADKLKPILIGTGAAIAFFVWFQVLFIPRSANLREVGQKVRTMAQDLKVLKEKIKKLPQMEKELEQMAGQYDPKMVTMLPEEQLPEFLQLITQAARTADVRLSNIKPVMEVSGLSPSPSGFLELPVRVDASGGYHNIGRFLDVLESSKALFRVYQIKIEPSDHDMWHHEANIVLWVYLFPGGDRPKS